MVTAWPLSVFTVVEQLLKAASKTIAPSVESRMVRMLFPLFIFYSQNTAAATVSQPSLGHDRKRSASSRRLIFPRSFTGISSTKKIRFGTCQPLS